MNSYYVILLSLLLISLLVRAILAASRLKALQKYQEFRIVVIGSVIFMYTSWLVIYMANVKPFIEPVFKKGKSIQK